MSTPAASTNVIITKIEIARFTVYLVCLMVSVLMQMQMSNQATMNSSVSRSLFSGIQNIFTFDNVTRFSLLNWVDTQLYHGYSLNENTTKMYDRLIPITFLEMQTSYAAIDTVVNVWDKALTEVKTRQGFQQQYAYPYIIRFPPYPVFKNLSSIDDVSGITLDSLQLISTGYLTSQVRKLTAITSYYNSNFQMICVVRISMDFTAAGQAYSSIQYDSFRLSFYDNMTDYTRMVFEIVFSLIYINYLYMEGYKIYFKVQVALKDDEVKQQALKKKESRMKSKKDVKKRGAVMQNDDGEVQQLSVKGDKSEKSANFVEAQIEEARRKTKIIINVVINHIKDIWSAIDVLILVLLGMAAASYIGAISSNPYSDSLDSLLSGKDYQDIFNDSNDYYINDQFALQADNLRYYRRMCGVVLLIMWIKLLKYFINMFAKLMQYLEIILNVIEYMIFYLVLLAAILISFALFFYFEYGSQVFQMSTIGRSINYILCFMFAQNDQFQNLFTYNEVITFIMTLIYYVIVIIILCNMFFVFVKSEYNSYQMNQEKEYNKRSSSKQHDEAVKYLHPFWQLFAIVEYFVMRFWFTFKLQPSKFDEYMENKELQYVINEREFKENVQTIDFNVDFANLINQSVDDDKNQKFLIEEEKERILSKQKMELIKLIWKTVLLIGILSLNFILLQEFYSPGDAFQQKDSIQRKIEYDRSNADNQFKDLMTQADMTDWLINGFPDLFEDNIFGNKELGLLRGETLTNYDLNNSTKTDERILLYQKKDYSFNNLIRSTTLNTFNIVVNNIIRVTVRRSILTNNTQDLLSKIAPETMLLFLESPTSNLNSQNENYDNFIHQDNVTGSLEIDYDKSNGIDGEGGLVLLLEPKELSSLISNLDRIGLLNSVSSLAIQFVTFNPINSRGLAHIKIWFTINQCGVLSNNQIETQSIKKNSLQNISEISILILSVSLIIALCYYLYITIKTMLHKNFSYDRWYNTYILLSLNKSQLYMRERHMPELIRKSFFLMDISQLLNLLFLALLGAQITLILYYFFQVNSLIQVSTIFSTPINDLLQSTLFSVDLYADNFAFFKQVQDIESNSKLIGVFGSCAILVLCLEILYLVSHNKDFQMLTNSMKYTLSHLPFIIIILFGIIVAFSSMGHLVLGTDVSQFSTFFGTMVQLIDYIQTINDISIIRLDDRTLEFYLMIIPYTITVRFIIMNMFFAITLRGYLLSKEQQNLDAQNMKSPPLSLSPQEFVLLSIQMISFKEKLIKVGSDQYLMQIIKQFQPMKVFTSIKDNIRNQTNLTAMKAWAEECAKEIKDEKEIRKPLDVACHELLQAYIDSNNKGEFDILQRLNTDPKRKLIEFSLKLTYINYFRYAIDQLDKFTVFFTKKREQTRSILFSDSRGEDYKQMIYICSLESQLEENIQSMTFIRQELLQLGFDIGEAGEIDSKENVIRIKQEQRQATQKSFFSNPLTNKFFEISKQHSDTPKSGEGMITPGANSDSEQPDQAENQFAQSQIIPKPSQFKQAQTIALDPKGEGIPGDQTTDKSTDEKAKSDQQKQSDEKQDKESDEKKPKNLKNIFNLKSISKQ